MKGFILAAGRGSRLKALTSERPKCLNKVGDRSLLQWQIDALRAGGIDEIIIITGYKADQLDAFDLRTVHNDRWESTNMVSSLLCASSEFDSTAVVSYSDIIYPKETVAELTRLKHDAGVAYDPNWRQLWESRFDDPLDDAESFHMDSTGRIIEIGQKIERIDDVSGQYMGIMRFSRKAFSWIINATGQLKSADVDAMDMTMLLQKLITMGYPIYGVQNRNPWIEIDTQRDFELANRFFYEGALKA